MRLFHSKDAGAKVFIAIPAYGNVPVELVHSLWDAKPVLTEGGILTELLIVSGGCHVDDVRNLLVSCFLESDCEQMVFIDDDTRFNAIDLLTLIKSDKDVIAGICPKKKYPLDFAFRPLKQDGATGLIEVEGAGTAFLKISRKAIETLAGEAIKYTAKVSNIDKTVPQIFERTTEDGVRWGGDYSFCRKWTKHGKIYVDTEMTFGHVGSTEFTGSLGHHLRETHGLTEQWIVNKLKELKKKPPVESDFIALSQAWKNTDWSADVGGLATLDILARDGEGPILECGSGLSSLIMAASGREVITLEHNPEWADKVRAYATAAKLDVTVISAPLKDGWYDIPEYTAPVSMLFIDGPPRAIANRSLITEKITPQDGCIVVVDDIQEKEILNTISDSFNIKFNDMGRQAIGVMQ